MDQAPKDNNESKNNQNPTSNRRSFLKKVSYLGVGLAGIGKAPMDIMKGEIEGNKKREGNAVTITLEDGKKVSLALGAHSERYGEGQVIPESEILAFEFIDNFDELFKKMSSIKELPETLSGDVDSHWGVNNTPVIREMFKSGKQLYQCDITRKDSFSHEESGLNANITAGYFLLALTSFTVSKYVSDKKNFTRGEFLGGILKSLAAGLSARTIARLGTDDQIFAKWNEPKKVNSFTQLGEKYLQLDNDSQLGSALDSLSKGEKKELDQIIVLMRSIIMALKLRSALRVSDKKSITMTVGSAHILVEDFVTMSDEELFKKLLPFREALKKYFNIETIYKMRYVFYGKDSKLNIEEKEDPVLRKFVDEYLK